MNASKLGWILGGTICALVCHVACQSPTSLPSSIPTTNPTSTPSNVPSTQPSQIPTNIPTMIPTTTPTRMPTMMPTTLPTSDPTGTTVEPTFQPSFDPSSVPTTIPSTDPTQQPTFAPTTADPTTNPTRFPSSIPTQIPSSNPTFAPSDPTMSPSYVPSSEPTFNPSIMPSFMPSNNPTADPTPMPTQRPFVENYNVFNFTTIMQFSIDNYQIEYRLYDENNNTIINGTNIEVNDWIMELNSSDSSGSFFQIVETSYLMPGCYNFEILTSISINDTRLDAFYLDDESINKNEWFIAWLDDELITFDKQSLLTLDYNFTNFGYYFGQGNVYFCTKLFDTHIGIDFNEITFNFSSIFSDLDINGELFIYNDSAKENLFYENTVVLADGNKNSTEKNGTVFNFKINDGCYLIEFWITETDNWIQENNATNSNSLDIGDFEITLNGMSVMVDFYNYNFQTNLSDSYDYDYDYYYSTNYFCTDNKTLICDSTSEDELTFTIKFDEWSDETSWKIINSSDNKIVMQGTGFDYNTYDTISDSICIKKDECYTLELFDSYGDGMNNVNQYMGDWGWYYLKLNNEMFITMDLQSFDTNYTSIYFCPAIFNTSKLSNQVTVTYESSDYFNLKMDVELETDDSSSSTEYIRKYETDFAVPISIANRSSKYNIFYLENGCYNLSSMDDISFSVEISDGSLTTQDSLSMITPTPVTSFEFCLPLTTNPTPMPTTTSGNVPTEAPTAAPTDDNDDVGGIFGNIIGLLVEYLIWVIIGGVTITVPCSICCCKSCGCCCFNKRKGATKLLGCLCRLGGCGGEIPNISVPTGDNLENLKTIGTAARGIVGATSIGSIASMPSLGSMGSAGSMGSGGQSFPSPGSNLMVVQQPQFGDVPSNSIGNAYVGNVSNGAINHINQAQNIVVGYIQNNVNYVANEIELAQNVAHGDNGLNVSDHVNQNSNHGYNDTVNIHYEVDFEVELDGGDGDGGGDDGDEGGDDDAGNSGGDTHDEDGGGADDGADDGVDNEKEHNDAEEEDEGTKYWPEWNAKEVSRWLRNELLQKYGFGKTSMNRMRIETFLKSWNRQQINGESLKSMKYDHSMKEFERIKTYFSDKSSDIWDAISNAVLTLPHV